MVVKFSKVSTSTIFSYLPLPLPLASPPPLPVPLSFPNLLKHYTLTYIHYIMTIGFVVNDTRPENEKDLEVGVASTIVDKMKPHQVIIN